MQITGSDETQYTEWAIKTEPSDYAVYTVPARAYLCKQYSILIVVFFYTR